MVRFARIPSFSYPNFAAKLPENYYKHLQELKKPGVRVHDKAVTGTFHEFRWNDEIHGVERVPDVPIPLIYPPESNQGLWGGEGIFKGYIKPRKYFQAGWPRPKTYFPDLKKVVLYSEILDQHLELIVTARTLDLVDEHQGLDSYLLRTPVQDLKSELGLLLRRQMLLTLAKNDFKTPEISKEMKEKYGDCMIPLEEAEWFGLPLKEALTKLRRETAKSNVKMPLKYQFAKQLIQELDDKKNNPDPDPVTPEPEKKGIFGKIKSKIGL